MPQLGRFDTERHDVTLFLLGGSGRRLTSASGDQTLDVSNYLVLDQRKELRRKSHHYHSAIL